MRAIGYFWLKDGGPGSPQEWERAFLQYCSQNQHQPAKTFRDAEASREGPESQFRQMVDYIRASGGQFLVAVPDASHLGNDLEGIARSVVELQGTDARVRCMDSDTPDPLQNALKTADIKGTPRRGEKIRKAMESKAMRGLGLGRPAYGYRIGPKGKLEVVPEEAPVVERIFQLYTSEKYGLRKIAEYLNQQRTPSRQKSGWNIVGVRDILKNIVYLGTYTRFGLRLHRVHDPIVSTQVFQMAQDLRSRRRPRRNAAQAEPFILSGLVYCGHCGSQMIGVTRRQSWKRKDGKRMQGVYRYYQCESRTNRSQCQYHTWQAPQLEEAVRSRLCSILEQLRMTAAEPVQSRHLEEATVKLAEQRFLRSFKKAAKGVMPVSLLGEYLGQLDRERQALQQWKDIDTVSVAHTLTKEEWDTLEPSVRQRMLRRVVSHIVVKDENVDIQIRTASPTSQLSPGG